MLRVIVRVVIAAAFWAAVVWFGLPWLKEKEPGAYGRIVRLTTKATPDKAAGYISQAMASVENNVNSIKNNPPEIPDADPLIDNTAQEPPVATNATTGDAVAAEAGEGVESTVLDEATAAQPAAVQEDEEDPQMAQNKDPGYNWGLVVTNSFFYDASMKMTGILAGGTVVESKSLRLLPDGRVAECFYLIDGKWNSDTVHLYESDLVLFEETYEKAPKASRDLLIEYCCLLGRHDELRAKLYKDMVQRNPHLQEYKDATTEVNEFVKKAKQAHADFEKASGSQRMELMDLLRKYKAEEAGILRRYNEVKIKYDSWKTENLGDGRTGRSLKTPEMQSIENKLNAMRPTVHEIVPGL